jgi:2-C-methyl-D-erythritol 4-phosphate cytidylyltransferase
MSRLFAIVPAAGSGARFGEATPKQYRLLLGRPLLHHALAVLCAEPRIAQVAVVIAPGDAWFGGVDWSSFESRLRVLKCGGPTRALSVRNALEALASDIDDEDWVLVHDAARPCLDAEALDRLIVGLADDEVGGLLATPVADTLKRADADRRAVATQSREGLWQAQTPQMFRRALLSRALQHADTATTDEAGAVEALGLRPKLVDGSPANLKVTYAQDFAMAEALLSMRSRGQG